jgi:Ran GTPase-activating protein (RanGAP) involved in mRNA processing and transport
LDLSSLDGKPINFTIINAISVPIQSNFLFKTDHSNLVKLNLKESFMGDKGVEILYEGLMGNDSIEELILEECLISYEGISKLSLIFSKKQKLKFINLSKNLIDDQGIHSI